jgi:hypothetical protein
MEAEEIKFRFSNILNLLMARQFGYYPLRSLELPRRFDSPEIPSCSLGSSLAVKLSLARKSAIMGLEVYI